MSPFDLEYGTNEPFDAPAEEMYTSRCGLEGTRAAWAAERT